MKKLIILLFILFVFVSTADATMDDDITWDIRTTGNDSNGGCYDLFTDGGTDYTQQDSPQYAPTDIDQAATTDITITSATAGFTAAMVDNCIQIVSGTNAVAGFYQIRTYNSTTSIDLDRAPDDGTALTGDTVGNVGGALLTINKATSNNTQSNDNFVESGTYTDIITWTQSGAGYGGSNRIIGWKTSRIDTDNPKGTDRPYVDGENADANNVQPSNFGWTIQSMRFGRATGDCIAYNGLMDYFYFVNVQISNCGDDGGSNDTGSYHLLSEINNNTNWGWNNTGDSSAWTLSYIHDNTGAGGIDSRVGIMEHCIIDTNSGDGVNDRQGGASSIHSIYYNNSDEGFDANGGSAAYVGNFFINNICLDNTGACAELGSAGNYAYGYNSLNGNGGTYVIQGRGLYLGGDNTSAPAFTDAPGGDFTLLNSSSPPTGIGLDIGDWLDGLTGAYKVNMGVDQDDNTVGGGSVTVGYGGLR